MTGADDSKQEATFLVRFHGVRGSHPVAGRSTVHFGGNTSCVEVESGDVRLAFDCGTGVVPLGDRLAADRSDDEPIVVSLFVSHLHHDHTMGFPFFKPVYDPTARVHVYGPANGEDGFQATLEAAFSHPFFPVPIGAMSKGLSFDTLGHGDRLAWSSAKEPPRRLTDGETTDDLVLSVFHALDHPNGGVLCFRLDRDGKSLVMATDVEGTGGAEGDLVEFSRGTDLLIHDAQYTDEEYETKTKGWGHSTWRMATEVARQADVGRLVLYHHDPAHDDREVEQIEQEARRDFPASLASCEGLEILV